MASETVDPFDWSHPPLDTGQHPLSSTYCTLQCGLGCKSQDLLHWVSRDHAIFGMPDQRTASAATQGIKVKVILRIQCIMCMHRAYTKSFFYAHNCINVSPKFIPKMQPWLHVIFFAHTGTGSHWELWMSPISHRPWKPKAAILKLVLCMVSYSSYIDETK